MATYKPRDTRFRAFLWLGDIDALPTDWLERNKLTLERDGTLIAETLKGPADVTPDGEWYIREHAASVGNDELWPVRRDIFEAAYEVA